MHARRAVRGTSHAQLVCRAHDSLASIRSELPVETENRHHAARLGVDVEADPTRFEFLPLLRWLERAAPYGPRLGGTGPYVDEAIRVRADPGLVFQASEITRVRSPESKPRTDTEPEGGTYELTTAFFGLAGTSSSLPTYLLEELAGETPAAEQRREFLDLFHHRIVSLFYRAVTRFDCATEYTRNGDDPWSQRLLALCGFAHDGAAPEYLTRQQLLRLAPLFSASVRSPEVLSMAIVDVFGPALAGASVDIEPLTGKWARLGVAQQAKLGRENHVLGDDFVLGDRCFDRASRAKVVLAGLDDGSFRRFMPDGDLFPVLLEVLDLFTRDPVQFDLELVLAGGQRPGMRLGQSNSSTLGTDAWLAGQNREETRVNIELPNRRDE
ncbi:MAG: type VI secretion system baseplate subunit TssG [Myxococcales bacterium FL481]|nr:MAG: type VI secretion system baseplate subunit TssG [Myxococcales bacterium FL481]